MTSAHDGIFRRMVNREHLRTGFSDNAVAFSIFFRALPPGNF